MCHSSGCYTGEQAIDGTRGEQQDPATGGHGDLWHPPHTHSVPSQRSYFLLEVWALEDHQDASDSEKAKLRKQLVDMAEEIFDSKQQLRRMRVQIIRDDLKKLEAEIEERDASRDELIADFVDDKLGENLKGL